MTENKARKQAIRARMTKTGERYTAARHQLLKKAEPRAASPAADPGISDAVIARRSGKRWSEWLRILDAWGATERSHKDIASYVRDELGVDGWSAQAVTVGYERARGMRQRYQGADGFFSVNVSKTVPVGVRRLFGAFADPKQRNRWLEPGTLRVRTTQPGKSARFDFHDGTRVVVGFTSKGASKSSVELMHERLPDADAVERHRAFWKEHLGNLARTLAT